MNPFISSAGFESPLRFVDFDTKLVKRGFRAMGREIAKDAKKSVSRKAVSRAGELPGRDSGELRKTIKSRTSRSGFSVAVNSYGGTLEPYYPAFVYYGHRSPGSDMKNGKEDRAQQHKKRVGVKVAAPRENWIVSAAERFAYTRYQAELRKTLNSAIKPGIVSEVLNK